MPDNEKKISRFSNSKLQFALLVLILLIGAYFRFSGINWDENYHLHPDERFLTMVESSISPVKNISEYFNTEISSLNPYNSGYSFFVYGTLPIFFIRYFAGWLGQADYGHVFIIGRYFSGIFDLLSILIVFLITQRLYKNKWMSLLAASLASVSVLSIQLSHYFTVDSFTNFFTVLAIYFAVSVIEDVPNKIRKPINCSSGFISFLRQFFDLKYFLLFGVALGMAAASKINTVVVAALLPIAVLINNPSILHFSKNKQFPKILGKLFAAAIIGFLVFRVFQPYAFSGPGFFNISLNPKWIDNLKELNFLSSGDSNFPPSLQWARRPIWFGLENLVLWGVGLPIGIMAIFGFLWMGKKIISGEWQPHVLLWIWTGFYFIWMTLRSNPTMRYFLPIYPTIAIIASWGMIRLWEKGKIKYPNLKAGFFWKIFAGFLIGCTLVCSFLWAFAFTQIYKHPVTRVSASEWIYQNVEAAINLRGTADGKEINIPLSYPHYFLLNSSNSLVVKFSPEETGFLNALTIDHIIDPLSTNQIKNIQISIDDGKVNSPQYIKARLSDVFTSTDDPRGKSYQVQFVTPISIQKGTNYFLAIQVENEQDQLQFAGKIFINLALPDRILTQPIFLAAPILKTETEVIQFTPQVDINIDQLNLFRAIDWSGNSNNKDLFISIVDSLNESDILATTSISNQFLGQKDYRGTKYLIPFNRSVLLKEGHPYLIKLQLVGGKGKLAFYGSQQANESSWDDAIPMAMYGYNPFDNQSGVYQSDLNFEMYWDDNQQKLDRFETILNQADYIYITSNRQWGSTTQIPERYPLTNTYYRNLIGCPEDNDIQWCYRVAQPGTFQGNLGFELIKVFQSDPNLGGLRINTQFAEEAFTVYDHPKVLIFKKSDNFSKSNIHAIFAKVDLTKVINLTRGQAGLTPGTLTMPASMKERQYSGGTWSELFNPDSIINSNSFVGLLVWYLLITVLGWIVYPTVRLALHGLSDKGYPITKLAGLLLLALPVWLAGSLGIEFNKISITLSILLLIMLNLFLFQKQKSEILEEIRTQIQYYLKIEIISLIFFLIFLAIRIGNPDLWHPYKGGEKPMDFSYFNAVLKSTVFPPYDPWFAGGYINYYYYGFVIAGVPVKWLGLNPSVAYNFILPTFFSFAAMGAFSFGWNIIKSLPKMGMDRFKNSVDHWKTNIHNIISNPYFVGLSTASLFLIVGNLGTVRMIFHGLQRLASTGIPIETGNFIQRAVWSIQGFFQVLAGNRMNFYPGDWYWIPSRAIPGEPITEFPFFTFLYADPHAHVFALAITILVLLWCLSILAIKNDWFSKKEKIQNISSLVFGAIVVGALRITNTWDFPIYLGISVIILGYAHLMNRSKNGKPFKLDFFIWRSIFNFVVVIGIFISLTLLLYLPYSHWYGQAYTSIELWQGSRTPLASYLTHWGLFLFITLSWWVWELRNWMATTPLKALQKISSYHNYFIAAFIFLLFGSLWMIVNGIQNALVVIPLLLIGVFLIFRKNQTDVNRFLAFLSLIGWSLTLIVELVVLKGDIGRMNTVFKFYLQAWTLLSITSAGYLFLILRSVLLDWPAKLKSLWLIGLTVLLMSVSLFPITATIDKISDRMVDDVPITLDGMAYMQTAKYSEGDNSMDLDQDYQGILWMQKNVFGSPVILEANVPEYRWGTRYTVYTGLPGVIGWNWHQRQQRAILPSNWVTDRIDEVQRFYQTIDIEEAKGFIEKYQVKYIIVGQLEKIVYPGAGLAKFQTLDGVLWKSVFQFKDTTIYEVKG
jgi:YYY domain-containing protein